MAKQTMSLEDLSNFKIEQEEITVIDSETGEEKQRKTVSRAEVAATAAYLLGVDDEHLTSYYSHHYAPLLEKLRKSKEATIIRSLSTIRTKIMLNYLNVDNEMLYNLSNLDRMDYFDKDAIRQLQRWEIPVIQANFRADKYIAHLTKLIDENIDACRGLFPESVKFEFIRGIFVIPKYERGDVLQAERKKFTAHLNNYPFQCYLYWNPRECGYLLYSDAKFLTELYAQHGQIFTESYKYHDASDDTKQSIYDYIDEANRVIMAVDCENADPYKLYGVLKNLKPDEVQKIDKIVLYDDYHTSIAWDYIKHLISIPVEHIEVPRIMDAKSLVDMWMAVGVSQAYYRDGIDSFILCSSDSDFWALISAIPDANYLVMYEYSKCGNAIKEALSSRSIFHCAMDDFYKENAGDLQQIVLRKVLANYLPSVVGENGWELTKQIFADAYITANEKEMERFYEKYIKKLRLKLDKNGRFEIVVEE